VSEHGGDEGEEGEEGGSVEEAHGNSDWMRQ
jgi:hypothetical protein